MKISLLTLAATISCSTAADLTIHCPPDAPPQVSLAAKEIRRYVYLRSGELARVSRDQPGSSDQITLTIDASLAPEQYRLKSGGSTLTIAGGSPVAVLYGTYAFAEKLGVRFYVHGDVVPDVRTPLVLSGFDETRAPLFATRGIQPFHDFPEGPDWWNKDDYLAYLGQLAKMRMNFLGLHCYPETNPGAEPLVWHGLPADLEDDGKVKFSYPVRWANTVHSSQIWGYQPAKTSSFAGGAAELFPADEYANDVMKDDLGFPQTVAISNRIFDRTGQMMREVVNAAHRHGVKVCIGTETPMDVPKLLQQHLRELGKDPKDPQVVRELYRGTFSWMMKNAPVDYYWLWTPEGWTWGGNKPEQFEATTRDIQAALDALKDLGNPFTLATSGWVLGPQHDRAALDGFLPKSSPMSCINRTVGHDGVEPAFANITGRPKWAIPWMENDPNMVGPQPWVARMRHDAVDARRFGCTGLLGIHWRTKALAPNIAALAAASWDQSWVPAGFDTTPVKPMKSGDGAMGGQTVGFKEPVAGTTEPAIYQTVRYDMNGYSLNMPDGTYTVTLQFNEPHYAEAGKRVFGVKIQDRQVLNGLDIFARAGRNKALDLSFPDLIVTDGTLRVGFTKEVEFPCIAGITITGKTKATNQLAGESFTRKINCGGGKVADYEADRADNAGPPPSGRGRAMPVAEFYQDFARASFGDNVAAAAGAILERIDGVRMPQVSDWKAGPGGLVANAAPWSEVRKHYAFVDELAALRSLIKSPGDLERFDYWLNTYRGMSAISETACARGKLDKAMAAKDYNTALTARVELADAWSRLITLQTSIVSTPGELGTIANLEQHTRRHMHFIDGHDAALEKALGKPLPPECAPSQSYAGPARLIVPTTRTTVMKAEALNLKIIALFPESAKSVEVKLRPLGKNEWQTITAKHVGRAVWNATLPAAAEDFEYHVIAESKNGTRLVFPATAPEMNQTVVVEE